MTNLPNSEQSGDLDNISVTRAQFREEIGVFLEYVAQALGGVTGNYTTQAINPLAPVLQGTPEIEPGATPPDDSRDDRIPSTRWVQEHGRYVGSTSPGSPADGMLWVDTSTNPYQLQVYNSGETDFDLLSGFSSGTRMLFQQETAPTGWTKVTTGVNNMALRVTTGNPSIVNSNQPFTTAFKNKTVSGGTDKSTVLSANQMPIHSHGVTDPKHSHACSVNDPGHFHAFTAAKVKGNTESGSGDGEAQDQNLSTGSKQTGITVAATSKKTGVTIQTNGGGQGHVHGFTNGTLNMSVNYVDVIIAQKD